MAHICIWYVTHRLRSHALYAFNGKCQLTTTPVHSAPELHLYSNTCLQILVFQQIHVHKHPLTCFTHKNHLSAYNGNCVILIFHAATKEAMCNSLNVIANQSIHLEGVSGSCNISHNYTTTECSLMVALDQIQTSVETSVTYDPCSTPYSFDTYINMPGVGVMTNETITNNRSISIGERTQISFATTKESSCYCHEVSSIEQFRLQFSTEFISFCANRELESVEIRKCIK